MKSGFMDKAVPPHVTKKMSLMYLESIKKFLLDSIEKNPDITVQDLISDIEKVLLESR